MVRLHGDRGEDQHVVCWPHRLLHTSDALCVRTKASLTPLATMLRTQGSRANLDWGVLMLQTAE